MFSYYQFLSIRAEYFPLVAYDTTLGQDCLLPLEYSNFKGVPPLKVKAGCSTGGLRRS